ncbi:hypothetical protein BDF14DRAFT_1737599, partial [Spinellus fusiger]
GVGLLVLLEGSVDQDKYINVLAKYFLPWFQKITREPQEDHALLRRHFYTRACAIGWKETHQIRHFDDWLTQIPDLNPIKHIGWALERRVGE